MTDHRPLRVLIVGAGIGGLTAAIALRRQGHHVDIYEQSRLAQETGAAIHLGPNANGLLRRFGFFAEDIGGVQCNGITEFLPNGHLKYSVDLTQANRRWQHPWHLVHRAHLHSALKDLATREDGPGRPAKLHTSSRVEQADPASASVRLANGTSVQGDVVLGADGVHSEIRKTILGGNLTAFDSGKSAFRFMLPTEDLASDPLTREFVQKDDHLTMWIGDDRRLVMYPCQSKTTMNFVAIHPSRETEEVSKGTGWQETGSKSQLLALFKRFGPGVAAILQKVNESKLKVWTLFDMRKMPSFVHERLAVMGDAAHPFLPHQGQGGGQAIEDAASLAALLPLGTPTEAVAERLRLYENCRYERSHNIQEFTRLAGRDAAELAAAKEPLDSMLNAVPLLG